MVDAAADTGRIGMTETSADALADFRRFNYEHVYLRPASRAQADAVVGHAAGARRALRRPAPPAARTTPGRSAAHAEAITAAVSYVAGMTDRFACRQAVSLLGWDPAKLPQRRHLTRSPPPRQRIRNPCSPSAPPRHVDPADVGPRRTHAAPGDHLGDGGLGPFEHRLDVPSKRLRTQPATPRASASRRHESRNQTPWTRPVTTTRQRTIGRASAFSCGVLPEAHEVALAVA